jgi:hypothetical protein
MRKLILIAVASLMSASAPAGPGSAQNFLDRANRLKSKGPMAFFDSDYKKLKAEAVAAGKSIGADRIAAQKAGKPILYCSPNPKPELGSYEFINGLEAIPARERATMSLKDGMLRVLQKKYPCKN